MTATCEPLNLVVVGHVDHGKSTVVGRLLTETQSIPESRIEQVRAVCEKNARPFEYAFLLDSLKDEQAQGITIDTARLFFRLQDRPYMILDAPGHREFLKNMITGAAKADAALLVVDAYEGICENSQRHGVLLSLLGVQQLTILINKMDLVGYSQTRFEELRLAFTEFLASLNLKAQYFIPVAAYQGVHISKRSGEMPWYEGPTAMQAIADFKPHVGNAEQPLRFPVQDIYKFAQNGERRRVIAGTVEAGRLVVGEKIIAYPSKKTSVVAAFETMNSQPPKTEAVADEAIGLCLQDQLYLKRGDLLCKASETPPHVASKISVQLFWLGAKPLNLGQSYTFKHVTVRCQARLIEIKSVVDSEDLKSLAMRTGPEQVLNQVRTFEIAECTFCLDQEIAFDPFQLTSGSPRLSRFVLFDGFDLSGGGLIRGGIVERENLSLSHLKIAFAGLKGAVTLSERTRHHVHGQENRHEHEHEQLQGQEQAPVQAQVHEQEQVQVQAHEGHFPRVLLLSGASVEMTQKVAVELERRLFATGHGSLCLDMTPCDLGELATVLFHSAQVAIRAGLTLVLVTSRAQRASLDMDALNATLVEALMEIAADSPAETSWVQGIHIEDSSEFSAGSDLEWSVAGNVSGSVSGATEILERLRAIKK